MIRPALTLFAALTLITGLLYPLAVTGIAQACFPHQANGSLIARDGSPVDASDAGTPAGAVGSALIGQDFASGAPLHAARYFWGRPSATAPAPYTAFDATALTGGAGSNLAPSNPALVAAVAQRIAALHAAEAAVGLPAASGGVPGPTGAPASPGMPASLLPVDLVTTSASGLDPDISPAAAEAQVARIAAARAISPVAVRALVAAHTLPRTAGVLGEPTVRVLTLNLALDALAAQTRDRGP